MLECVIFLLIFISAAVTAIISTLGWLKVSYQNEDLREENEMLKHHLSVAKRDKARLNAKLNFYKNCAEEKENEQKSN